MLLPVQIDHELFYDIIRSKYALGTLKALQFTTDQFRYIKILPQTNTAVQSLWGLFPRTSRSRLMFWLKYRVDTVQVYIEIGLFTSTSKFQIPLEIM